MAVITTPRVDRSSPCPKTGLIDLKCVSNPPEKRITFNETIPMNCATCGLLKIIPPGPSIPASIPTAKKNTKVGTPNLKDVLPTIIEKINSVEPTSNMFSAVKFNLLKVCECLRFCRKEPKCRLSQAHHLVEVSLEGYEL